MWLSVAARVCLRQHVRGPLQKTELWNCWIALVLVFAQYLLRRLVGVMMNENEVRMDVRKNEVTHVFVISFMQCVKWTWLLDGMQEMSVLLIRICWSLTCGFLTYTDDGCNESQGGASSRDAVASTDRATAEHGPSTSGASVEASSGVPAGPMLPTEASQEAAIEDEAVSGEAV